MFEEFIDLLEGIRPAFGSPGGKRFLAKKIVSYIPEHKTYVEPFVGGGAVFFAKESSEVEVINDKDSEIAFAYRFIKEKDFGSDYQGLRLTRDKGHFERLKNLSPRDDKERFYKFLYLNAFSMGNARDGYSDGIAHTIETKIERLPILKERLTNTKVYNQDFRKIIQEFDSANTFFYIDPPYPKQQGKLNTELSNEGILETLKTIKGKWILSNSPKGNIKNLFKDYHIKEVEVRRTMNMDNAHFDKELLISNFPLKKVNIYLKEETSKQEGGGQMFSQREKNLYEAVLPYEPEKARDDQLADDWRIMGSWISTLKEKGEFKYTEDEILNKFTIPLLKEILKRGKQEFHPENWKELPKELYLKAFDKIVKKFIRLLPGDKEEILSGERKFIILDKKYLVGNFYSVIEDDKKEVGYIRLESPEETEDNRYKYQIRDFIPKDKSKFIKASFHGMFGERKKLREDIPIDNYEYLIHHIETNPDGKEKIHHCHLYDHIGNLFEQSHLLVKDGKVFQDGKEIKDGVFHFIKGLEPTQEVAWTDEEASEHQIKPKKMIAGMALKDKAKVW